MVCLRAEATAFVTRPAGAKRRRRAALTNAIAKLGHGLDAAGVQEILAQVKLVGTISDVSY